MRAHIILVSACLIRSVSSFAPAYSILTSSAVTHRHVLTTSTKSTTHATKLYEKKPTEKPSGVYARPSAAIERGSGFYVPGLEGSRVRILFGVLVLLLSYVNNLLGLGDSNLEAVQFSEKMVIFFGTLLLIQGLVEAAKEAGLGLQLETDKDSKDANSASSSSSSSKQLSQMIQGSLRSEEEMAEKVKWAAATYVALTSATHALLLDEEGGDFELLYSLGDITSQGQTSAEMEGIQAALETVYRSKGGRVSVPDSHPCATLLPEDNRRCILLQKVEIEGRRRCLMIGSNQLLVAFTKNDLKWLGTLGGYLSK